MVLKHNIQCTPRGALKSFFAQPCPGMKITLQVTLLYVDQCLRRVLGIDSRDPSVSNINQYMLTSFSFFLNQIEESSVNSSKLGGSFPEVLHLNRLFHKLNSCDPCPHERGKHRQLSCG